MDTPPLFAPTADVWPARLLCIDDWTSYRRRSSSSGGVWYGDDQDPKYAIISYTWGRYRNDGRYTRDGAVNNTYTPTLPVRGIDWNVPSIDPEKGFSSEDFEHVLEEIADLAGVRYVWVDVACIDQNHDYDDQVGAQASIFRKASAAFIWLHQIDKKDGDASLEDHLEDLADAVEEAQQRPYQNSRNRQQRLKETVLSLFKDPYFSSLWTLQESFLRKDAILLSSTGETARLDLTGSGREDDVTLRNLIDLSRRYLRFTGIGDELHRPIEEASLDSLVARNPMVTFRAARHRTSSKLQDRIFGIQQVFGVHVGPPDNQRLSLLESRLSFMMNRACPALAQIFVHQRATSRTASWKAYLGTYVPPRRHGNIGGIEETLDVPKELWDAEPVYDAPMTPNASWDERYPDDLDLDGYSAPFEELWEYWRQTEAFPPGGLDPADYDARFRNRFDCSLHIDKSIHDACNRRVTASFPIEAAHEICHRCPGRVRVLVLGQVRNGAYTSNQSEVAWVGLLITPRGDEGDEYNRNGFCTWRAGRGSSLRNCYRRLHRIGGYDTEDPYMVSQED